MRYLRWVGFGLSLLGVGFVVVRLAAYADDIGSFRPGAARLAALAFLAVVYGASNVALALAWRDLLKFCGSAGRVSWAIRTYGIAQLAKYVPGNVFHFAGRQALGMSDGHGGPALLKSAAWEMATIIIAAGLFVVFLAPLWFSGVSAFIAAIAYAVLLLAVLTVARRYSSREVARAVIWHSAFLAISGAVFFATLVVVVPSVELAGAFPVIGSAYIVAWLAGAVAPGAPAGIGIREVVLYAMLQPLITQSDLLIALVLSRAITAAGDVLYYLYALSMTDGD